ncbi:MAG: glycosyltransferase family 39 protein [Acidobacteria bacterium]|nr:glycosyltransferase family 39 protein [Acidobacteriota bacterium]
MQTPREMVQNGNWIIPHFNGKPRLNKPPLSYWLVAVLYRVFGVSVFWERLIMALLATGSLIAVYCIGSLIYSEAVALWGAAVFATTFRFLLVSRRLLIDGLTLFCVLAAVAFFLSWLKRPNPGRFRACTLFFALGFLSKGPVALLPVVFLLFYLLAIGKRQMLRRVPWTSGPAIFMSVGFFWFALVGPQLGWERVADFFWQENFRRYSGQEFGPARGPFYYLGVFMGDFFPWSLLLVAALFRSPKTFHRGTSPNSWLLLLLWGGTYFFFFSFSQNKQEYYILPIYPAAALWISACFANAEIPRLVRFGIALLLLVCAIFLMSVGAVLFPEEWLVFIPSTALILGTFLWLLYPRLEALAGMLCVFYLLALLIYLPALERYQPVRHLASAILREQGENGRFQAGYFRVTTPSLAFYLNRPILELYDEAAAMRHLASSQRVYLIIEERDLKSLEGRLPAATRIVDVRPKLYTTARNLAEGMKRGRIDGLRQAWVRSVYLICNQ